MKKILLISALITIFNYVNAQIYYSEISEERYYKIASGTHFHPAKILFHDGEIQEGFVARFSDSSTIRFRKTMDKDANVKTYNEKDIKSFIYGLEKYNYPQFVYKNIGRKKENKIRPLKIISRGTINIYGYGWAEPPNFLVNPHIRSHTLNMVYYLEKDGDMYGMWHFKRDIVPLIKDNEEVFIEYKKIKHREAKPDDYINIVNLYNEKK